MINIKAIFIGVGTIIFLGLIFELIFLFIDVGVNSLLKIYPAFASVRQGFYYIIVAIGLFFVMFTGGYLASVYAEKNTRLHSVLVAVLSCALALYATSGAYELTAFSVVFVVLSIAFTLIGNLAWKKNTDIKSSNQQTPQ